MRRWATLGLCAVLAVSAGAAMAVWVGPQNRVEPEVRVVPDTEIPGLAEVSPPAAVSNTPVTIAPVAKEPVPAEIARIISVKPGDTLMKLLQREGIDGKTALGAIMAMQKIFDPRDLKAGQELNLVTTSPVEGGTPDFVALRMAQTTIRDIVVRVLPDGGFEAEAIDRPTEKILRRAGGTIVTSLYEAAVEALVPLPVLANLINVFSFDVDFQREIQKDDGFALMYESVIDDRGEAVDYGDVLIGEMTLSGTVRRYYRFKGHDGFVDYFDGKGQSVRKALLRTPVEGARISSRFGKRKHPVLGYYKLHKGLDFAAPKGTPVFAAGDGIVEMAGWNGSFGNYVRIRHNGAYKTAYAHMDRIGKGLKKGQKVRQRQIIGYVGSSGRSTGSHLHYEVLENGKQTNPMGVKLPTGRTLKGGELAEFQRQRARLEQQYAVIESVTRVAAAETVE